MQTLLRYPASHNCWKSGKSEFFILVQYSDSISIERNSTVSLYGVQRIFTVWYLYGIVSLIMSYTLQDLVMNLVIDLVMDLVREVQ